VNVVKEAYEARSQQSKARKWLTKFSERVMQYGKVMDTFANYDPQYCALAWGTMKFLLMARLPQRFCWESLSSLEISENILLPSVDVGWRGTVRPGSSKHTQANRSFPFFTFPSSRLATYFPQRTLFSGTRLLRIIHFSSSQELC
jgi:hypothetical protein